MENEEYIESGLSVGTMKIANKNEILTEEEVDAINNKIPELDERVSIIEYEIEDINSSLDDKASQSDLELERNRINNIIALPNGSTTGDAELLDIRVGVDGTTHKTAGDSVRNQITNVNNNLKQLHSPTKKGYFNNIGVFNELSSWTSVVDFIPVKSISSINVALWWSQAGVLCYDKMLNYIGAVNSSSPNINGTEYITNVDKLLKGTYYIKYCYSNNIPSFVEYSNSISDTLIYETEISKSIIGETLDKKYYNLKGELVDLDLWFAYTTKIPIKAIKSINIPLWKNVGSICCYDNYGDFIGSIQSTNATPTPSEFFTDLSKLLTGTCYITYCYRKDFTVEIILKDLLKENVETLLSLIKTNKDNIDNKDNKDLPLQGKKILSLGDSYTFLNYYGKALEEVTGAKQTPRGWNGAGVYSFVADQYTPTGQGGVIVDQKFDAALLEEYDIVTIMGGTNDYGRSRKPLGDINYELGDNSFYGALKYVIDKILSIKPTIKIVLCTEPYRLDFSGHTAPGGYEPNSQGFTMKDVSDAIKEVGAYYGIPVFDFYSCSGWNSYTIKKVDGVLVENPYTYDGLHPKSGKGNGGEMLGKSFGYFINNNITF